MNAWRRRRLRRGSLLSELERELRPVAPPNALVVLWRWRWELAIAAGLGGGLALLVTKLGWVSMLIVPGIIAVAWAWPEARSWLVARIRCIVIPHRVRTGCAHAWIQSRNGKLPIILMIRARPYGEQVFLWCRAGITPGDFVRDREVLRVACWAADVRVSVSARHPQIVILDVIRELR